MEEVIISQNNYLNTFLQSKLAECTDAIKTKKTRIFYIKLIHYILLAISTIGTTISGLLASFFNPDTNMIVESLSAVVTICIFLSINFNTEGRMKNLGENLQKLNIIKNELAYITSCNGRLTDQECKAILDQLGNLIV